VSQKRRFWHSYFMTNGITSKGWNLVANTPLGQAFAAKLAAREGGTRVPRDHDVRTYFDNVHVRVEHDKVVARVEIDDFGSASRNAVAAQAIIGDVQRALQSGKQFEVLIVDSPSRCGVHAALDAYFKDLGAQMVEAALNGEHALHFIATRRA
jgi:hypothetical protein